MLDIRLIAASVCLLIVPAMSIAAPIQYDSRAAFEAATASLLTETFNGFVADVNLNGGAVLDVGDFTITGPAVGFAHLDAGGDSITPVDGTAYIQGIAITGDSMVFTFDSGITAFGVDLFGVNDNVEKTRVIIGGDTYFLPVVAGDEASFFGLTTDVAFTTVTFSATAQEDAGLDNISYGQAARSVPEPTALALFGLGLAGLGFARRRKAT